MPLFDRILYLNAATFITKERFIMTKEGKIWVRHYASWIQPFAGGIFTKGEMCWAMYTTDDEDLMDSTWFSPKGLRLDLLEPGMASLSPEDAIDIVDQRGHGKAFHGHNLLRATQTIYKALIMHERPAK